jgi:DNA-binding GntR family transcriptional regulator
MNNIELPEAKSLGASDTLLSQRVCDTLTDWIINGVLIPGYKLKESDISNKLGVSRIPVREALKVLEKNGLVEFIPYQGCRVKVLTLHRMEEIYVLRKELESFCARISVEKITDKEIEELEKIQVRINQTINDQDYRGKDLYMLNRLFHMKMYEASRLPMLVGFIEQLWNSIAYYRLKVAHDRAYPQAMEQEHTTYIILYKKRDGDGLARALKENLQVHYEKAVIDFEKYLM